MSFVPPLPTKKFKTTRVALCIKKSCPPPDSPFIFSLVCFTYVIGITLNGFLSILQISNNLYVISSVLFDL